MASTQRYLGAATPFGLIVQVENRVYNPQVTVARDDGSTGTYALPFLIARGVIPSEVAAVTSADLFNKEV